MERKGKEEMGKERSTKRGKKKEGKEGREGNETNHSFWAKFSEGDGKGREEAVKEKEKEGKAGGKIIKAEEKKKSKKFCLFAERKVKKQNKMNENKGDKQRRGRTIIHLLTW